MSRMDGARAKVQRAKENLNELVAQAREFASFNPYGVVIENNPNTGERIWRARVSRSIPNTWSILTGDVVHGLRAALDYLAWELWIANGGNVNDPLASAVAFPITDSAKTYTPRQQAEA